MAEKKRKAHDNAYAYLLEVIDRIWKVKATNLFKTLGLDIQEATLLDLYTALDGKDTEEIGKNTLFFPKKSVDLLIDALNTPYANELAAEQTYKITPKNRKK